jgi:hypothetical protein
MAAGPHVGGGEGRRKPAVLRKPNEDTPFILFQPMGVLHD